jgi:hypothetical protein
MNSIKSNTVDTIAVSVSFTVYGVLLHKASQTLQPLLIYCASSSEL